MDDDDEDERDPLGWHVIPGTRLLDVLRRCSSGESADLVFAEMWANSEDCGGDQPVVHEVEPSRAETALSHVRGFISCLLAEPTRQTLRVIDKLAQRGLARLGEGRTS
jgi:hypothetical protein